jgi:hypothetical protein
MDAVRALLSIDGVRKLIDVLRARGYAVVGPTVRNDAIVYDDIESIDDLPRGWTDEQDAGRYRLKRRDDDALFGYAVGPQSWKRFLFPPVQPLWRASRSEGGVSIAREEPDAKAFAFIGVRSCELHAIAIQDRVFTGEQFVDPHYAARRSNAFIVAVNCAVAGGTCFCVSMKTGPKATAGYDLALTETISRGRHHFYVEAASEAGRGVLAELPSLPASSEHAALADAIVERTAAAMGREMAADGLRELLQRNREHPRWEDVANRCLSCSNCTMACPTCFCSSAEDVTTVAGELSRTRHWDSCFNADFSYIFGGNVRESVRSRYRQWMTHKLSSWIDQFGTSGCVGCGRCITWCPAGIDITEEVRAIRASEAES